jgi:hypothetical protein
MLSKIISGGQTGADQAGLAAAKKFGLQTGGWMPKGFKTLDGLRPDMGRLYSCKEHTNCDYGPRTEANVADSDGTIRLAGNFGSAGEACTLRAIRKNGKPYIDVDLTDPPSVKDVVAWIAENKIRILNVAGNSEKTYLGAYQKSYNFLIDCFFQLGLEMILTDEDIISALNLPQHSNIAIYHAERQLVETLTFRRVGVSIRS